MKAEFSEFTYGFSLVNELAKTLSCTAVPIFPSLIQEGKEGGGYDAKLLSKIGTILNLQFKLSDCMIAPNAREYRVRGHNLTLPYYRFGITSERISEQHSLLLELEDIQPLTFYVAPKFHLNDEINAHWSSHSVSQESVYVKPSSIGDLSDPYSHSVCFDRPAVGKRRAYFFSDAKDIEILPFHHFSEAVMAEVIRSTKPLETSIGEMREKYRIAIQNARQRERRRTEEEIFDFRGTKVPTISYSSEPQYLLNLPNSFDRTLERLDELLTHRAQGDEMFRQIAQVSTGIFGTQAIAVVQQA